MSNELTEAAAREIFTSRAIDWNVITSEQRFAAAASIIQRHVGPRIEALEAEAAALRRALVWTLPFREFSDSWHNQQNEEVVHFRKLRSEALSGTAGRAFLERHAAEVAELRERLRKAEASRAETKLGPPLGPPNPPRPAKWTEGA